MFKVGDKVKYYGNYNNWIYTTITSIEQFDKYREYYIGNRSYGIIAIDLYRPTQEELDLYYNK